MYEYVIWDLMDKRIHRGPWTKEKCENWLQECRDIFPDKANIDKVWAVYRREVGQWHEDK